MVHKKSFAGYCPTCGKPVYGMTIGEHVSKFHFDLPQKKKSSKVKK